MSSEHLVHEMERHHGERPGQAACFVGVSRALAWSLFVVMALLLGTRAAAQPSDAMVLEGSEIALSGITIRDLSGGQVVYADVRQRVVWRDLDEVEVLRFAELPELERVEMLLRTDRITEAAAMLRSLVGRSERRAANLWLQMELVRLARLEHDDAALSRHFAELVLLQEDSWWRTLLPVRDERAEAARKPMEPEAAAEALPRVNAALEQVRHPALRSALERMRHELEPVAALAPVRREVDGVGGAGGPGVRGEAPVGARSAAPERTVEMPAEPDPALLLPVRSRVRDAESDAGGRAGSGAESDARSDVPGARDAQTPREARLPRRAPVDPRSLSQMLQDAESAENPRDRARALVRAGEALTAGERPREAVLAFLRAGLAYPETPEAPQALLAAAALYADQLNNRGAAMRLARRVMDMTADDELAEKAWTLIERLAESGDR